jgi:exonuclease SbcC
MKPIQLLLRNFKGIKAGMGLDEVTVDFASLNGIIVFSAPNGSGKTTILDSLHPYRLMPYRAGNTYRPTGFSYYDHTYGDAVKVFIFEVDGVTYKSKVLIDTDRKKAEAYLYIWRADFVPDEAGESGTWDKYPGVDGKLEAYDRAVEEVLGSPELFFTSIFRAQNAKALSDYSKGDIKDLFVELLNISHLQAIGERARRVKQDLSGKVEILMVDRKRLQDAVAREPETLNGITATQADISCIAGEIESYEQEIITLQERINELDVKTGLQKKAREEVDKIRKELNEANVKYRTMSDTAEAKGMDLSKKAAALGGKVDALRATITTAEEQVTTLPYLRSLAEEKTTKDGALEATRSDIRDVDASLEVMNKTLNDILSADKTIAEKELELDGIVQKRLRELSLSKRDLEDAKKQAEYIKSSGCPVDNPTCKFMKAAVEKRDRISDIECDIAFHGQPGGTETALQAEIDELKAKKKDPATIRGQIATVTATKSNLLLTQKSIEADLQEIARSLESLPLAEQAEAQLPEFRKQLQETEAEAAACEAEAASYAAEVNKELVTIRETIGQLNMKLLDAGDNGRDYEGDKEALVAKQAHFRTEIEDARIRQQGHNQHLGALEETMKQIDRAKGELDTIAARIAYLNDEVSQWATLEKAFGNDGIIALELDDAGPQISATANELLQVFGGRFAVRIDTQSAKAAGGMKEVFDITVFDNQTDEQKSIKRLSGGEKTWIEDAVTKAICIYNKTASGRQFKTIYTDEKDGALDFEKKKEFFAMKRRVLELGGYDREICITQSPELMAMADGVIRLSKENGVEVITNA